MDVGKNIHDPISKIWSIFSRIFPQNVAVSGRFPYSYLNDFTSAKQLYPKTTYPSAKQLYPATKNHVLIYPRCRRPRS